MKRIPLLAFALLIAACQPAGDTATEEVAAPAEEPQVTSLAAILDSMPDEMKARYQYRHPQETLEFFGIEPGMTVMEGLPGGGWYTKILLPYLGKDGHLIGADYSLEMWPKFGFVDDAFMENQRQWTTTRSLSAWTWRTEPSRAS